MCAEHDVQYDWVLKAHLSAVVLDHVHSCAKEDASQSLNWQQFNRGHSYCTPC